LQRIIYREQIVIIIFTKLTIESTIRTIVENEVIGFVKNIIGTYVDHVQMNIIEDEKIMK